MTGLVTAKKWEWKHYGQLSPSELWRPDTMEGVGIRAALPEEVSPWGEATP